MNTKLKCDQFSWTFPLDYVLLWMLLYDMNAMQKPEATNS